MTAEVAGAQYVRVLMLFSFVESADICEVEDFKQTLQSWGVVSHSGDSVGSFEFYVETCFSSFSAYALALLAERVRFANLIVNHQAGFVTNVHISRRPISEECFWVPSPKGLQRLSFSQIDSVHAEGDYMRLQEGSNRWLLHETMSSVSAKLGLIDFTRLHRSVIVRRNFIRGLSHRDTHWVACLNDDSEEPIAKSRVRSVMRHLTSALSKPPSGSSKILPLDYPESALI